MNKGIDYSFLKIAFEKLSESNEELLKEISRYEYTYVVHEAEMTVKEKAIWEEFFSLKNCMIKSFQNLPVLKRSINILSLKIVKN